MASKNDTMSFPQIVEALEVGESHAKVVRVPLADIGKGQSLNDRLAGMRAFVNQAVTRIRKKKAGSDFRVETSLTTSTDREACFCMVIVTRIDEEVDI